MYTPGFAGSRFSWSSSRSGTGKSGDTSKTASTYTSVTLPNPSWNLLSHRLLVATVDDAVKQTDPKLAASLIKVSHDAGFDAIMVSSMWTPGAKTPSAQERLALANVVRGADAEGMRVFVFVWHGLSGHTPRTVAARRQFAAYAAALARTYPQIRDFVIGNEPNLNTFWLPQFGS